MLCQRFILSFAALILLCIPGGQASEAKKPCPPCKAEICTQEINTKCEAPDYKKERCSCCKKCVYPPPKDITCITIMPAPPAACLTVIHKCTPDQYIDEMCSGCQNCEYK